MARSIQTIYNQIVKQIQSDTNLYDPTNIDPTKRGLVSTSVVAIWKLFAWIFATSQNLLEQLQDVFKREVEDLVTLAAPGTPIWIQDKVFKFQYSATTPQIIQFNQSTFIYYYPVVNTALRIVTQCSVTTSPNKVVLVKVATGGTTPAALSTPQQNALISYLDYLNFAGVQFQLISTDADLIMLGYDVYYDGQYAGSIEQDVKDAIVNYLTTSNVVNFNGLITLAKIEDVIQSVAGVKDVVARQVEVRPSVVLPVDAYKMVDNFTTLLRNYQPYAGYIIVDTDTGRTLDDTLTFTIV